ncbi:hypothetical protein [Rickettsiella grylli]|nr:hypothetical protein [Rickettsiella grylli]
MSFFGKSKQLESRTKQEIITPVDCVTKIGDRINLFDYLEDAYKEHVAKLEIQCIEEKYKQLTGSQQ